MSECPNNLQIRFRLEEAKFFYQQMELNLQNRTKFVYFLDAFLASARSVSHVFKKEFKNANPELIKWYESKVREWKNNKVMKFFVGIRNISLKEHTPKMKTTATVSFGVDAVLVDRVSVTKVSPDDTLEQAEISPYVHKRQNREKEQKTSTSPKVVSYSFHELPKWFDENPDVMRLCKTYLDELEKFVAECEDMIKKE